MPAPITCEISAADRPMAGALAHIARTCAQDLRQPLRILQRCGSAPAATPVVTLHLPAALAASQNQIWCLACRLACFCPDARVSVLVSAASEFARPRASRRRGRAA